MEQNRFAITWVKSQDPFEMREIGIITQPITKNGQPAGWFDIKVACMASHDGRNWVGQTADSPFSPCYLGDNQDECRGVVSYYISKNLCTVRKCASEIRVGVWGA